MKPHTRRPGNKMVLRDAVKKRHLTFAPFARVTGRRLRTG